MTGVDAKFNREPLSRRQLVRRLGVAALAAPLLYVGVSFPVGLMRTATDHKWCTGESRILSQPCVARRRAERFGPFKAWGWNNHTSGD